VRPDGDPAAEVEFRTSGQSGEPVGWLRTRAQLHAETALLARSVVGEVDRVVNYAPPRHLYGRLFGELLPAHLGVPVHQLWRTPLTPPHLPADARTLLVCLPSTWVVLRSVVDDIRAARGVVAVHSTGPTTAITHTVVRSLADAPFRAVEILGATETGAIAHRRLAPRGPDATGAALWTLFDDVTLVRDDPTRREQPLCVASPRLARRHDMPGPPATLQLEDLVRPVTERRFELLGRTTRMIKVNGRRLRLEHVEEALRRVFPHADLVCVPKIDRVRAEHYDVYYASGPDRIAAGDIYDALAAAAPGTPPPRRVHRVPRIPRGGTGKVRLDRLLAVAEREEATSGAG